MSEDDILHIKRITRRRVEENIDDKVPSQPDDLIRISSEEEEVIVETGGVSNWEKLGRVCMYLLVALTPLFFLPWTAAPVEINKQFLGAILVFTAFICYLADGIKTRRIVYPKDFLSLGVLTLFVVVLISAFLSKSPAVSFSANLVQPDTLLSFGIYVLAFFMACRFFNREDDLEKVSFYFLLSLSVLTLFGLLQIFQKFTLPWGFTKNISWNPVGSVFGWGILMAGGLALIANLPIENFNRLRRNLFYGLGALFLVGLIILNYQFIWISLAVLSVLFVLLRFTLRKELRWPLVLAVASIFFSIVSRYPPPITAVPFEVWPSYSTTLTVVKHSISGTRAFLGSGPGTFGYEYSLTRPSAINLTNFWNVRFNQGYNFLGTSLGTIGILGFLALISVIFLFIRTVIKNRSDEKLVAFASGILFLIFAWVFYPGFFTELAVIFIGLGLIAGNSAGRGEVLLSRDLGVRPFATFIGVIVLLSLTLTAVFVVSQRYAGAVLHNRALAAISAGDLDKALTRLDRARQLNGAADDSLRVLSQALLLRARQNLGGADSLSLPPERQAKFQNDVALAVQFARQATQVNPADSLNWENLGSVYESLIGLAGNAQDFARDNYNKAAEVDPINPQQPVNVGRVYVLLADLLQNTSGGRDARAAALSEALNWLQKSVDLKPDYAPAHFLMAQVFIRQGEIERAIGKGRELEAANPADAGLAFQLGILYYQNNQFGEARREFERAVAINASYANARYFLGLVYDRDGLKAKAIEQFENIEKFNPDNAEVKRILVNLRAGRGALEDISPPAPPPEKRREVPVPEKQEKR